MKRGIRFTVALGILGFGAALVLRAGAFIGPTQGGGSGVGAVAVDNWNNIVLGSTTLSSSTRIGVFGSTTDSTYFGLKVSDRTGSPIFWVRNDGKVSVATSSFTTTSTLRVAGYIETTSGGVVFPDGTVQTSASISGTSTPAANVTAGTFGSAGVGGNYAFPSKLSVGTSTIQSQFYVFGPGSTSTRIRLDSFSNTASEGALLELNRAHNFSSGLPVLVANGDTAANIVVSGYEGGSYRPLTYLKSLVGVVGGSSDDISSHMTFSTRPTGVGASPVERIRITETGSVGVGTSTPATKFHVYDSSGDVVIRNQSGANVLDLGAQATNYVSSSAPLDLRVNGSSRLYIATSGIIGVGTSTPTFTFDVNLLQDGGTTIQSSNVSTGTSAAASVRVKADTALATFFAHGTNQSVPARFGLSLGAWNEWLVSAGSGLVLGTSIAAPVVIGANNLEIMRFATSGDVVVGTTTVSTMTTTGRTLSIFGGLCLRNTTACPTGLTAGSLRVDTAGSASDDPGDVFDVAETYGSLEPVSPGDLVRVGREDTTATSSARFLVAKTNGAYDGTALGIVSTKPAVAIRDSELILSPNRQEANADVAYVALAGRVWTRVSSVSGPIRPGDLVTASDAPGVGMRATKAGRVLGMALGTFAGPGEGRVMVFVNPHFWGGPDSGMVSRTLASAASALRDLGLIVREGVLEAREVIVKKLTAAKVVTDALELKDAATGETYCVRIVRGEFEKTRGVCAE